MYPDSLTRWNWLGFSPYAPARTPRQASLQDVRLWMPVCVSAKRSIRIVDGVGPAVVVGFQASSENSRAQGRRRSGGYIQAGFPVRPRADNKHFLLDRPSREVPKERAQSQGSLQDPSKIVSWAEKTLEISVFRNPPSEYGAAGSRAGNDAHRRPSA